MIRDASRGNSQVYLIKNYSQFQKVGLPKRDADCDKEPNAAATALRQDRDKEETFKHSTIEVESSLRSDLSANSDSDSQLFKVASKDLLRVPRGHTEEEQAFTSYNDLAREMHWPQAQRLNLTRRRKIRARLKTCGGIPGWQTALGKARASPFLRGESGRNSAHADWVPDLDFFLQEKSFTRLMEGKYDERHNGSQNGFSSPLFAGAASAVARRRRAHQAREGLERETDHDP